MRTRLSILADFLEISAEHFISRFMKTGNPEEDNNVPEFFIKKNGDEFYFDVLTEEELDDRAISLVTDLFSDEEIEENYPGGDFSSIDINTYLHLLGEVEGYFIYVPEDQGSLKEEDGI